MEWLSWDELEPEQKQLLKERGITKSLFDDELSPDEQVKSLLPNLPQSALEEIINPGNTTFVSRENEVGVANVFDKEGNHLGYEPYSIWANEEDKILDKVNEELFGIKASKPKPQTLAPEPIFPKKPEPKPRPIDPNKDSDFVIMDTEWGPNNTVLQISARHVKWNKEAGAYLTVGAEFNKHYKIPKSVEGQSELFFNETHLDDVRDWSNAGRIKSGLLSPNSPVFNESERQKFINFVKKGSSNPKVLAYNGSGLDGKEISDFATVFEFNRTKEGLPGYRGNKPSDITLLDPFPGMKAMTNRVIESIKRKNNPDVSYSPLKGKGVFTLGAMYQRFVGTPISDEEIKRRFTHEGTHKEEIEALKNNRRYINRSWAPLGTFDKLNSYAKKNGIDVPLIESGLFKGQAHDARFDTQMLTELLTTFRYLGGHFRLLTTLLEQGIEYTYDNTKHTIDKEKKLSPWSLDFWKLNLQPHELKALVSDFDDDQASLALRQVKTSDFVSLGQQAYATLGKKTKMTPSSVSIGVKEREQIRTMLMYESYLQSNKEYNEIAKKALKEQEKIDYKNALEAAKKLKNNIGLGPINFWDKITGGIRMVTNGVNYTYLYNLLFGDGALKVGGDPLAIFLEQVSEAYRNGTKEQQAIYAMHMRGLGVDPGLFNSHPDFRQEEIIKPAIQGALSKYTRYTASKGFNGSYQQALAQSGIDPKKYEDILRFSQSFESDRVLSSQAQTPSPSPHILPLPSKENVKNLNALGFAEFDRLIKDPKFRQEALSSVGFDPSWSGIERRKYRESLFREGFNDLNARLLGDRKKAAGWIEFSANNSINTLDAQNAYRLASEFERQTQATNTLNSAPETRLDNAIRRASTQGKEELVKTLTALKHGKMMSIDYGAGFNKDTLLPNGYIEEELGRSLTHDDITLKEQEYSQASQSRTEYRRGKRRYRSIFFQKEINDALNDVLSGKNTEERQEAINRAAYYKQLSQQTVVRGVEMSFSSLSKALVEAGKGAEEFREKLGYLASSTWDVASPLMPRNVYRAGKHWVNSFNDFRLAENIIGEKGKQTLGSAIGQLSGGAIAGATAGSVFGPVGTGVGALIGLGTSAIPVGINSYYTMKNAKLESVGTFIRGQVGMWSGLIELLKIPVNLLRGSFLRLNVALGRFWNILKNGLDLMTRMGIPYTNLTGMTYYDMFKSNQTDSLLRQGKGTSMSKINEWALENAGLYTSGQFNKSKLIAAARTGNFANLYGYGMDPVKGTDATITNLANDLERITDPGLRAQHMRLVNELGFTREVETLSAFKKSGYVPQNATWEDVRKSNFNMYIRTPSNVEGNRWSVTSHQWGLAKQQGEFTWIRLAQRMWDSFGMRVINVLNELGDALVSGEISTWFSSIETAWGKLKKIFLSLWDDLNSSGEKSPFAGIWETLKKGLAKVTLEFLPTLAGVFSTIGSLIYKVFLKALDAISPLIDELTYLYFDPSALLNGGSLIKSTKKETKEVADEFLSLDIDTRDNTGAFLNLNGILKKMPKGFFDIFGGDLENHVNKRAGEVFGSTGGYVNMAYAKEGGKGIYLTLKEKTEAIKNHRLRTGETLYGSYIDTITKAATMWTLFDGFKSGDADAMRFVEGFRGNLVPVLKKGFEDFPELKTRWEAQGHKLSDLTPYERASSYVSGIVTDTENYLVSTIEDLGNMVKGLLEGILGQTIVNGNEAKKYYDRGKEKASKLIIDIVNGITGEVEKEYGVIDLEEVRTLQAQVTANSTGVSAR